MTGDAEGITNRALLQTTGPYYNIISYTDIIISYTDIIISVSLGQLVLH